MFRTYLHINLSAGGRPSPGGFWLNHKINDIVSEARSFAHFAKQNVHDSEECLPDQIGQALCACPKVRPRADYGGVAEWLNAQVSKTCIPGRVSEVRILPPPHLEIMSQYKVVTYVPIKDADAVREAIAKARAGKSAKYSHASFSSRGVGRFLPLSGARPAIGKVGKLEKVNEEKIEVVCDGKILKKVIATIQRAHPYEEPAIEAWEIKAL